MSRGKTLLYSVAFLFLGGLALGAFACSRFADRDALARLEPIKSEIRQRFPEVARVSTDELQNELQAGLFASEGPAEVATAAAASSAGGPALPAPPPRPLLLDVRRPEEYAVSHLPGATRVDPAADLSSIDSWLPTGSSSETPIVVYCSVGYRSARLAEVLQEGGFTQVRNLEGSIFEWAAKGYPLERDGQPVAKVHPYGRAWAWMVDEELRAFTPQEAPVVAPGSDPRP